MGAVGIEATAVALMVVLEDLGLRDEVHDVEAEAAHALLFPEAHDVRDLVAYLGVAPVEVGLCRVKQVQAPLAHRGLPQPGGAAELRGPVGGQLVGVAVAEEVIVLVALLAGEGAAVPLVVGRRVVQDHVEHDADAAGAGLAGELLEVSHGAVARVDGAVVGDVIAVVALRGGKEGRQPDIVDAELGQVVELLRDAAEVSPAVAVRVLEALRVDLVDDLVRDVEGLHGPPSGRARPQVAGGR